MKYRSFFLLTLVVASLVAGCITPREATVPVPVSGKVTVEQQGVQGVQVEAYPVETLNLGEEPLDCSRPSGPDGHFRLKIPAGEYYLLARGEGFFSYYGRNPVNVPPDGLGGVNIALVPSRENRQAFEPFVETGIAGQVTANGQPLAGATIYVYTDLASRLKGMGYAMAGPTDDRGFYELGLSPGTYYLLARKREGQGRVGPLRAGDHVGYFPNNPVVVGKGKVSRADIPALAVPERVSRLQGSLYGDTSVRGRVLDREGSPLAGMRVLAYDDPKMFNRPLFVSQPTDPDGKWVLSLPHGGTFYFAARDTLGGAPGPGELYGTWDETPDHAIELSEGQSRKEIDIVVEEMW